RALESLGITPEAAFRHRPRVWVSITGYGRSGDAAMRVAFGDDAAAAGGAVLRDADGLTFCSDALADPVSGLFAAAAALDSLAAGGRWVLDVAMSSAAATVAPDPEELAATAAEPRPLRRPS